MEKKLKITIYGDSIMKGTVYEDGRYRAIARTFTDRLAEDFPVEINNRARFGFTIDRGMKLIDEDIAAGDVPNIALIEYGGNDCNFDWPAVAAAPTEAHLPATPLAEFVASLASAAEKLQSAGVQPVFTSLPPIDAARYYAHICGHGVDGTQLMRWLGDVQTIYHFQELYSSAVASFAFSHGFVFIDARAPFLEPRPDFARLISIDGLHPSEAGYELMYGAFRAGMERFFSLKRKESKETL